MANSQTATASQDVDVFVSYMAKKKSTARQRDNKPPVFDYELFEGLIDAMNIEIKLNLIAGEVEFTGIPAAECEASAAGNVAPQMLLDEAKRFYSRPSLEQVHNYIYRRAQRMRYNPVIDYLKAADAEIMASPAEYPNQNVSRLMDEVLHLHPEDWLSRTLISKWLVQSVAMAHNGLHGEPYGADGVLLFQGPQGAAKGRFFTLITPNNNWYREITHIDMNKTDSVFNAVSAWIIEVSEVDYTLKREQAALKGFITQAKDNLRKPYARAPQNQPRRTSIGASVNNTAFLRDETGNRRWWTVSIDKCEWHLLEDKQFIKGIWAEAMAKYISAPQSFRLTDSEREALSKRNGNFDVPLLGEDEIRTTYDWSAPLDDWHMRSTAEIISETGMDRITPQQLGRALERISKDYPDTKKARTNKGTFYQLPPKG